MNKAKKYLLWFAICLAMLFILSFVFRYAIFAALGHYLVHEEKIEQAIPIFVLSGNAYDRGNTAASLFKANKATKIFCTGANISNDLKAEGVLKTEAQVTKDFLLKCQVPDSLMQLIPEGTSTMEERNLIHSYCIQYHIREIGIVTSKFHTRRVNSIFKKSFSKQGIKVKIVGAKNSTFDEEHWWQSENGLIAFAVEYIKLFYYKLKY